MSSERDLAWQKYDLACQSSIAYHFARYAIGLKFESLPKDVVHQAKRSILDGLGNAMGGYDAPGRPVCEAAAGEMGGLEEATLFGSGSRTSALNAALVNSFLVRFPDYHDQGGNHHGCDAIASILALCEREKAGGREFLTSLVVSYELGARVRNLEAPISSSGGFIFDTYYSLTMPAALGRLMGLTQDQIANAIGTCASHSFALQVIMSEEPTMSKNIRAGFIAHDALLCCILAKNGFTGPLRVVEGECGLIQTLCPDFKNLERLVDFSDWRILDTRHKFYRGCGTLLPLVSSILRIVNENDLKPEDIEAVRLTCWPRFVAMFGKFPFKYPRNAETADHSLWYTTAIVIKERRLGPDSYESEKFIDPVILDLIERITVEPGLPETEKREGMVEIITKNGRRFRRHAETPHGFGEDPLTDEELEEKFREMAAKYMSEDQIQQIFDTVWNLEHVDDMQKLTSLMVFQNQ